MCLYRSPSRGYIQGVWLPGGSQWHKERLWERWINLHHHQQRFLCYGLLSVLNQLVLLKDPVIVLHLFLLYFDSSLCVSGEDPLAGDQNDHEMDSIAGVLKLYFRGLEHALIPKEVFHDLMSCVCECPLISYTHTTQTQLMLSILNKRGVLCWSNSFFMFCQPWRTSRTELSTSVKSCCRYPATPWSSWDTCLLSSSSECHCSKLIWKDLFTGQCWMFYIEVIRFFCLSWFLISSKRSHV